MCSCNPCFKYQRDWGGEADSAATAYLLPWKHLGCTVNREACHKNQLWHGEVTASGTVLTAGARPLGSAHTCLQRRKRWMPLPPPPSLDSSGLSTRLERVAFVTLLLPLSWALFFTVLLLT